MVKAKAKTKKSRVKKSVSNVLSEPVSLAICAIAIVVTALAFVFAMLSQAPRVDPSEIGSFKECVEAGYPIQESYPERCATPSGTTFINPDQTVVE